MLAEVYERTVTRQMVASPKKGKLVGKLLIDPKLPVDLRHIIVLPVDGEDVEFKVVDITHEFAVVGSYLQQKSVKIFVERD